MSDFNLQTLYRRRETGGISQWTIGVSVKNDNNSKVGVKSDKKRVYLVTSYGQVDGKIQTVEREVKEVCRENSLFDRAKKQAQKKWEDHQNKEGYVLSMDEAKQGRPFVTPMLAQTMKIEKKKKGDVVKKLSFPFFVQPKIDGFRCMACIEGKVDLLSRKNIPFKGFPNLKQVITDFATLLPTTGYGSGCFFLDGELFVPNVPFEELSGSIKKGQNREGYDVDDIQFRIFDCYDANFPKESFGNRINFLQKMMLRFRKVTSVSFMPKDIQGMIDAYRHKSLQLVPTYQITNMDEMKEYFSLFMGLNYEGLMGRDGNSEYEPNKRSWFLQKYKEFQDAEFEIVGYEEGSGRDKGTVVWKCKTENGEVFSVRPKGSLEIRREWFEKGDNYIGQKLTVTFQELSEIGVPRFPVGKCIRVVD